MKELEFKDYTKLALSMLSNKFRKVNFENQIKVIGAVFDELQETIFYINSTFFISSATGYQLDIIGKQWDVKRQTLTDVEFRKKILKKSALKISGTTTEIKTVLKEKYKATYAFIYPQWENGFVAQYRISTDAQVTIEELEEITQAGVKILSWQWLAQEANLLPITAEDGTKILVN